MRRLPLILLICLMIISTINIIVYAQQHHGIKVILDGEELNFDVEPTIIDGRTMVPFRKIFSSLGVEVEWDGENRGVRGVKGDVEIYLKIDSKTAYVNDSIYYLDVPATIIDGRTFVPARFVGESLGAKVDWDGSNKIVKISTLKKITIGEFIKGLVEVMGWGKETITLEEAKNLAIEHGSLLDSSTKLSKFITKEEAELMFIRSIGYDPSDGKINYLENPIIRENINVNNPAKGIILDMYDKINKPIEELHAFYAIRSYDQKDLIQNLKSVSFGWSRLEIDSNGKVQLKMDKNSDYYLPVGYEEVVKIAKKNNATINLMVYASQDTKNKNGIGLIEYILKDEEIQKDVITQIVDKVLFIQRDSNDLSFDGVVIDFENIRKEELAQEYINFLKQLKARLIEEDKKLYVMVHPRRYFKGYDYRSIGRIADRVILMAHDYHSRKVDDLTPINTVKDFYNIETPLTPLQNVINEDFDLYNALEEITDEETGVADKAKIWLQISFDAIQWRREEKDGQVRIWSTNPPYNAIVQRLKEGINGDNLNMYYSKKYENPYFIYYDRENSVDNIIWYEDTRSVLTKINLAKMFGIRGISIWRLGNIPVYDGTNEKSVFLNTWENIINECK